MQFSYDTFGGPDPLGATAVAAVGVVLIAAWVALAGSRFIQGGIVERPERVPQLYGYAVCLVTLVWALSSAVGLVESGLTLMAPAYHRANGYGFDPSVTSFEAFRLTYDRARRFGPPDPSGAKPDTVPEAELRRRYAVLRADRIAATEADARQALVVRGITLLLAGGLFAAHWRWLRRRAGAPAA